MQDFHDAQELKMDDSCDERIAEGKLVSRVDIQEGLENAPATLHRLFEGANEGKQLLRVAS